jgi:phospholipid/cholesterol/gamma-HCH transport system substrate-binding protein
MLMPAISKEIKIALLGIVAILVFVFGYNYLKGTGLFSTTRIVAAEYDNVQGLTPSSYVQLQGFNVGMVKSIELSKQHPGKVVVEMSVQDDIQIPVDSRAAIASLDLLGTKAVALTLGKSSQMVENNQLIAGDVALGTIETLGAAATPAIDNAKLTLSSLNQTIQSINQILDDKTKSGIQNTLSDVGKTMKSLSEFAAELNAQKAHISSLLANLDGFSDNLQKNNKTITGILNNAEVTTAHIKDLDLAGTLKELKTTMDGLQQTLDKVNNGKGSMAMLMNDDKLYKNLKNTLATANNLLADVNARPSRYINVAIFGKKNKNDCPPQPAPNAND